MAQWSAKSDATMGFPVSPSTVSTTCIILNPAPVWTTASAAVLYVPDDHPTIQAAVDAAAAGDEIIVRDGIHAGPVVIDEQLRVRSENGPASCSVDAGGAGWAFSLQAPASAAPNACNNTVQEYFVSSGDTLSKISQAAFGDQRQWPRIFEYPGNAGAIGKLYRR